MPKVRWTCAHCGLLLEVDESQQRAELSCPKCKGFSVPGDCVGVSDTSGEQVDLGKLGFILGESVMATADKYALQMERIVPGDKAAVRLNLIILLAWIASKRITQSLPLGWNKNTANCMHMRVFHEARGRVGNLGFDEIQDLLRDRYLGYYQAWGKTDATPSAQNLITYFFASAGHFEFVDYNKIVPDPKELSQVESDHPGVLTPGVVESLRKLQDKQGVFTYPLTSYKYAGEFGDILATMADLVVALIIGFLKEEP